MAASGHLLNVWQKAEVLKRPLCYESDKIIALQQNVAKGHKRTFRSATVMSALLPKADIAAYSITSSARASTDGGIVRPIALAVLRLITR